MPRIEMTWIRADKYSLNTFKHPTVYTVLFETYPLPHLSTIGGTQHESLSRE